MHSTAPGKIASVEVIQRKMGTGDHYRFIVIAAKGARWYVVTTENGTLIERGRETQATIVSGH